MLLVLILGFMTCADFDKPLIPMERIPGGTFMMGNPDGVVGVDDDAPQHQVTLSGFYMGKYEVTQKQWVEVMGSPLGWSDSYGIGDNYPVYDVIWYKAIEFCNRLSMQEGLEPVYRILISGSYITDPDVWGGDLFTATWYNGSIVPGANGYCLPTEAEWEYACRAGTTTAYNTGDEFSDSTGWSLENSNNRCQSVGKKSANKWGLYDMHGNMLELCWDYYANNYGADHLFNPMGPNPDSIFVTSNVHVVRGGSFDRLAEYLRSARREYVGSNSPFPNLGFRVVRH